MELYNVQLEQSVLSAIISGNGVWAKSGLDIQVSDFYAQRHQAIFNAVTQLRAQRMAYDSVMLHEYLESRQELPSIGGLEYLGELLGVQPASKFVFESYVKRMKDFAMRRNLQRICQEGLDQLTDFDKPTDDLISETVSQLNNTNVSEKKLPTMDELLCNFSDNLTAKREGTIQPFINIGFIELGNKICLDKGELCVIAGRPAMGKSTLAQNILTFIEQTTHKPSVFFSLEMPSSLVVERLISAIGTVNLTRLRSGGMSDGKKLTEEEYSGIFTATKFLHESKIIIDDTPRITVGAIRAKLNKIKFDHKELGVVVIDYLGLMGGISANNRVNDITEITGELKSMAKAFDCPIILLSQLNRGVESRPNKRPVLADLRDSGSVEQDADKVIAIYRDEVYNKDSKEKGIAEALVLKNRNGEIGTVRLGFEGQFSRFNELIPNYDFGGEQ